MIRQKRSQICISQLFGLVSGIIPGEGNGNPLHYSFLEDPMDRGSWQATVHRVARVGHDLATKPHEPEVDPHQTPKLPAP